MANFEGASDIIKSRAFCYFSNRHFVFCARKIEYRLTGTDCNTHTHKKESPEEKEE